MLQLPPEKDRLITMTIAIDRDGNVYQDTETHNNPWSEVYRGTKCIQKEIERLIEEQRRCPIHPKTEITSAA
jgi:hypothetical protein